MSDFSFKNIENELNVAGRVAAATPGKIIDEIQNDWNNDKSKLIATTAESAAVGFATGIVFKAAPAAALLATGLIAGAGMIGKAAPLFKDAWNADSEQQRDSLVNKFSSDFGKSGATMMESLPGFVLGGKAASISFARSEAIQNLTYRTITKPIEYPLQEKIAFHGPGSALLPEGAVRPGSINVLKLSETVPLQNGVEMARSLDLTTGKASRIVTGTASEVTPKFEDKAGRILIHTHSAEAGPRPGLLDLKATEDFGIIRSGKYTTFYEGQKGVVSGQEQLRALIMDHENKQAFLLHNQRGQEFTWNYKAPQYVDYEGVAGIAGKVPDVKNALGDFAKLPKLTTQASFEHLQIARGEKLTGLL